MEMPAEVHEVQYELREEFLIDKGIGRIMFVERWKVPLNSPYASFNGNFHLSTHENSYHCTHKHSFVYYFYVHQK